MTAINIQRAGTAVLIVLLAGSAAATPDQGYSGFLQVEFTCTFPEFASSAQMDVTVAPDGAVTIANFDGYPLLTMKEAPDIAVTLLEAGDGRPRGVGEPPIGPTAAAIGNALFTLTGARCRELPLTPERVLARLG